MKYASEVLDLMAAAPGRPWRMAELVRGASGARELTRRERNAMRQAILRVLVLKRCARAARWRASSMPATRSATSGAKCDTMGIASAPDAARQCIHVVALRTDDEPKKARHQRAFL
ncbi:hypothetical protein WJ971_27070 [Achromobacter xylosoxidans]